MNGTTIQLKITRGDAVLFLQLVDHDDNLMAKLVSKCLSQPAGTNEQITLSSGGRDLTFGADRAEVRVFAAILNGFVIRK